MAQFKTQAENITTDQKLKIYFTLPEFSPTKIVTWNFHVDASTNSKYDIVLRRYL